MRVTLLGLLAIVTARDLCSSVFSQPEIEDVMKQAKKDSAELEECVVQLITQRMWDMATFLLDKTREHKVPLKGIVKKQAADMRKQLDIIINSFGKTAEGQM